tara:strand:+ start:13 stop:168 length:156 start_codon:yes stop_codon:yes gene_type:complete
MIDLYVDIMTTIGLFVGMCVITATYTIYIGMWSESKEEIKRFIDNIKEIKK